MYTLTYRISDGIVEEIEQHDYEWIFENVFDDKEYKTINSLPKYNKYRQFLRVVNDEVVVEDKNLSETQIKEIEQWEKHEELQELKNWFNYYYAQHEQKYRRLIALNILTDENTDPNNELINLYNQAEIKRKRIQELEKNV